MTGGPAHVESTNGNGASNGNGIGHGNGQSNGHSYSVVRAISPEGALAVRSWRKHDRLAPGNVRQVENVIERLVVTGRNEVIQVDDLSPDLQRAW